MTVKKSYRTAPCKDCTEKYEGCHGKCEAFLKYKADIEAIKEKQRKDNLFKGYLKDKFSKIRKEW